MFDIHFVTPPGIEAITVKEVQDVIKLHNLSVQNFDKDKLELTCDLNALFFFNICLRTPNRILVRALNFRAVNFAELVHKTAKYSWENFINPFTNVKIRTTCKKSRLYHSDAVTERIIAGIEKRVGFKLKAQSVKGEDVRSGEQLIVVRFFRDECTISVDSSGIPLYQRGYRKNTHKAPIRENLAAAMLMAANWNPNYPLIDPFCGSGTIPIEAAYLANNIPPGINRNFQFMQWSGFNENKFQSIRKQSNSYIQNTNFSILGSDRNEGAITIAKNNLKNTDYSLNIQFQTKSISDLSPQHETGFIITNPPYGLRISDNKDIRNLFAQFGNVLIKNCNGWQVLFLCNDIKLATQTKLPIKKIMTFSNGGIPVAGYFAKVK